MIARDALSTTLVRVNRRHDEPGQHALDHDSVDRSARSRQQRPYFGGLMEDVATVCVRECVIGVQESLAHV